MHEFSIWAPKAQKLSVQIGDDAYAMTGPTEKGWWSAQVESAQPGDDYAVLVNDDPTPYPDPRSLWQPDDVHGPSRIYDLHTYSWSDAGWQPAAFDSAIIYELHVG